MNLILHEITPHSYTFAILCMSQSQPPLISIYLSLFPTKAR